MSNGMSDAFVFFGATGDLAYKQIFPSLQDLIRDEGFNLPIIGVAKAAWTSSNSARKIASRNTAVSNRRPSTR
jgi:glucose-6-phosphate 1-dehydrogenase